MNDFITCPYCEGKGDSATAFLREGDIPEVTDSCFVCQGEGEASYENFIPLATKPRQVICFYPFEVTTQMDGDAYFMLAVDVFSDYVFPPDAQRSNSIEQILKSLKLLIKEAKFKRFKGKAPFTLVLHKHQEHRAKIEEIITPYGGRLVINDAFVAQIITPVMMHITNDMNDFS
jgi:hypothetical protein